MRMLINSIWVETILFDDIVPFLPKNEDITSKKIPKAVLKIDVEGYEPYAFSNASLLFNSVDIQIIFMEWFYMMLCLATLGEPYINKIIFLIEFLFSHKFRPYSFNGLELEKESWRKWTGDIVWKKT